MNYIQRNVFDFGFRLPTSKQINLGLKSTRHHINKKLVKKCPKCGTLTDRFYLWDGYKNVPLSKIELEVIKNKNRLKKFISSPKFIPIRRFFHYQPVIDIPVKIKDKYYKQIRTGGRGYICLKCKHTFKK